ncbi:hypothetical protein [Chryseobacterium endophyticum]|uniref:Uncharacterized protein n=1 Tax=Chryseobacterium endophyticum TaxID=1854762 RepID=A0AAU6WK54_9FLAO
MKKVLFGLALAISCLSFGQKVKIKKGQAFIDDKLVYNVEDTGTGEVISDLKGNEIISILRTTYETPKNRPLYPNERSTWTNIINTVRFLKNGKELLTDLSDKDIIKNLYKSNVIDESADLDDEKVDIFINKYNNDNLRSKLGAGSQSSTVIIQQSNRPRNGFNVSIGR